MLILVYFSVYFGHQPITSEAAFFFQANFFGLLVYIDIFVCFFTVKFCRLQYFYYMPGQNPQGFQVLVIECLQFLKGYNPLLLKYSEILHQVTPLKEFEKIRQDQVSSGIDGFREILSQFPPSHTPFVVNEFWKISCQLLHCIVPPSHTHFPLFFLLLHF